MPKAQSTERQIKVENRNLSEFFMKDYYSYAQYTIAERALPSIIDGLKPGARKIMHAAFNTLKAGKEEKFINLVGNTLSMSNYSHGDASLLSTMMTLSAQHQDILAPLEIVGTGATLKSNDAAAPRYLSIQLAKYSKLLLKDIHILEHNYEADKKLEPKWYLPILPLILTARTTGMAIGYKYDAQVSYNPANIAEHCISLLKHDKLAGRLRPHIEQWAGHYIQIEDRIWAEGVWTEEKDKLIVTEFAPNQTFESFENNLKDLLEKGKIVKWENKTKKGGGIKYIIHVNPAQLANEIKKKTHKRIYNLGEFLKRPTYTLLDENGKIIIFSTPEEILRYFVEFRLGLYDKLKDVTIKDLTKRIEEASIVRRFIDLYLSGKIVMNHKTTMEQVFNKLDEHKLPHWVADTKMSKLTKDEYDKLTNKIAELEKELKKIQTTTTKALYLQELEELLVELKKDFPLQPYSVRETETE